MNETATRELILKYFNAWQTPSDWETLRYCLADDVAFDSGTGTMNGGDELVKMMRDTGTPWEKVTLIGSIFHEDSAALMYDGLAAAAGAKFRVAEHLEVNNGKITSISAAICPLGAPQTA